MAGPRRRRTVLGPLVGVVAGTTVLVHLGRTYEPSSAERATPLPGGDIVTRPNVVTNHAVTINATAESVWPWAGADALGRGGWYTARWVDHLCSRPRTERRPCRRRAAGPRDRRLRSGRATRDRVRVSIEGTFTRTDGDPQPVSETKVWAGGKDLGDPDAITCTADVFEEGDEGVFEAVIEVIAVPA